MAAEQQVAAIPAAPGPRRPADSGPPPPGLPVLRPALEALAQAGESAAAYFFGHLFTSQPGLRALFPADMTALLAAFPQAVRASAGPAGCGPGDRGAVTRLGGAARRYGIEPRHYPAAADALKATLLRFAGGTWTPATGAAWDAASAYACRQAAAASVRQAPPWWLGTVVSHELRGPGLAVIAVMPEPAMPYLPGQHVAIQVPRWQGLWRRYSIAAAHDPQGLLWFHVRQVPGGWVSTALVRHTPVGSQIRLSPPAGEMTLTAGPRDLLCVAGGTGLAPLKAIAGQAVGQPHRRVWLFHGARTSTGLYDMPALWSLAEAAPRRLHIYPVVSDDHAYDGIRGALPEVVAGHLPGLDCAAYVAGPPAMVSATTQVLRAAGLPATRIHHDPQPYHEIPQECR